MEFVHPCPLPRPRQEALAALMREQLQPVRAEPGCLSIDAFASTRDPRLFFFHSRWVDETRFDLTPASHIPCASSSGCSP